MPSHYSAGIKPIFQLISELYEHTSLIITSNKGFNDWTEMMGGDPVITTTILDRIMHYSEIFNLSGKATDWNTMRKHLLGRIFKHIVA
ncbi:MAG: ATP-binding protein [Halanaerobiales bacterium]|nr:ATP-binding protein [Halanaerobiales bacterium]